MGYSINTNMFEEIKFDADNVKTLRDQATEVLTTIGKNFGFDSKIMIARGIANGHKMLKTSNKSVYDIIVELKAVVNDSGRFYHSRSEFTQVSFDDKQNIKGVIEKATAPLYSSCISDWFMKNLNRIVAADLLLTYSSIDQQAMNLEVALKQFHSVIQNVHRNTTGDFGYRTTEAVGYGVEPSVKIGLTEKEQKNANNNQAHTAYYSNDREIKYTIKHDWYEKVFKNDLSYINLNDGKVAAVLDAEPTTHKTQEEDTNLWKLKVAYVKVPREVVLWRNSSKENVEKCVHFEEIFYAIDKDDAERCATGTTAGRAIGTLNRRAKKQMFELMGLDAL